MSETSNGYKLPRQYFKKHIGGTFALVCVGGGGGGGGGIYPGFPSPDVYIILYITCLSGKYILGGNMVVWGSVRN